MSRQINFYLTTDDLKEIDDFIKLNNLRIIGRPLPTAELFFIESVRSRELGLKPVCHITLAALCSQIQPYYIDTQNYYLTDITKSPAIEFWQPYCNAEEKIMRHGRLYYTKQYYNAAGELVQKDPEFLATADKLLRWIRKTFKDAKLPGYEGLLVSPRAAEWARTTGGKLLVNN